MKILCLFLIIIVEEKLIKSKTERNLKTKKCANYNNIHFFLFSLREDNCLVIIIEPIEKLFEDDGVRPEFALTLEYALDVDKRIKEAMKSAEIPFVQMFVEDIQERFDFVVDEILKRWPDLKRGHMIPIPDEEKPKVINTKHPKNNR